MKIAVCDDNKLFLDEISSEIQKIFSELNTQTECFLFNESQKLYESEMQYDLAFIDIEMPEYSGIEVAKKLKERNPHIIIFIVTSYDHYLDDAMDLNVFRYIKKPLDTVRLKNSIVKALDIIDTNQITFFFKNDDEKATKSVLSNDIIYIEISGRSTHIITNEGDFYSTHKISYFKEKLVASFFYQIHKSYIINMKYITDYQYEHVTLQKNTPYL